MATDRERAVKLREAGLGYKEIAIYLEYGIGTVYRWTNPEAEEACRRASRAWKATHVAEVRAYDRAIAHVPCPFCEGVMGRQSEMCVDCVRVAAEVRQSVGESAWADGYTSAEFHELTGYTPSSARRRGWDMPYRRTPEQVARIRAGSRLGQGLAA